MTAIRVVTDHKELNNSGQYTHSELDNYVSSGPFLFVSGASGQITPSARRLKAGPGVIIDDEGPGGYLTITATVTASSCSGCYRFCVSLYSRRSINFRICFIRWRNVCVHPGCTTSKWFCFNQFCERVH